MSPELLNHHLSALEENDVAIMKLAVELGQAHLFTHWPKQGAEQDKRRQLAQLRALNEQYPGGLSAYVANARRLLDASRRGENPYEGFTPRVPDGQKLEFASPEFATAEAAGLKAALYTGFVLVAGGLGERLGFSGIKIALPSQTLTGSCFLALYVKYLLALQARGRALTHSELSIPLAIMTSDDTDQATRELLAKHDNFGMAPGQITLVKQEKVPSLLDNEARFAQQAADPYTIETKPHGHGDVHVLLHQSGLAQRWLKEGRRHLAFFQDTNALVCHALTAALGVSDSAGFAVNTLVVPRRAAEAAGGIVRLEGEERTLTINVEYNQLDPLLRATVNPSGDVADESGYSPYPGNTNVLVINLETYVRTLDQTGGAIPEFVNPKYADAARTAFKKPTRLECMMQDFPKLLSPDAKVGFTRFDRQVCFSAVKNNLSDAAKKQQAGLPVESASTGEGDLYGLHRRMLQAAGAEIAEGEPCIFGGITVSLWPPVLLEPQFALTLADVKAKIGKLKMTARSSLHLDGPDIHIADLELDGGLSIRAVPGAKVTVRGLKENNPGMVLKAAAADSPEPIAIRGFQFVDTGTRILHFDTPGEYVVES